MFSKLVNALSSSVGGAGMCEDVAPRYGLLWEKNDDSVGCRACGTTWVIGITNRHVSM